jgi:hypothetical protein
LLDKIAETASYSFGEEAKHLQADIQALFRDNERLRVQDRVLKDFETREAAFLQEKNKLFSDLKDRIQKVLVLEEELDLEKDRRYCLEECLQKNKVGERLYQAELAYN